MKRINELGQATEQLEIIEQLESVMDNMKTHIKLRNMNQEDLIDGNWIVKDILEHNIDIYNRCIVRWNERMERLIKQLQE